MSSLQIVLLILASWVIGIFSLTGVWVLMVNRATEERDNDER